MGGGGVPFLKLRPALHMSMHMLVQCCRSLSTVFLRLCSLRLPNQIIKSSLPNKKVGEAQRGMLVVLRLLQFKMQNKNLPYCVRTEKNISCQNQLLIFILLLRHFVENNNYSQTILLKKRAGEIIKYAVNSLVSDHPWYTTKWSLMGSGRFREKSTK